METQNLVSGTFTAVEDWSAMLGRGGNIQYYISFKDNKKKFFNVGEPKPIPDWHEVYMNVHPLAERPESGRGDEKDVVAVGCVYCDFDVKDGWNENKIKFLNPLPSALLSSGHGWYGFWFFTKPEKVNDENFSNLKRLQENWVKFQGADNGAKDLARVLRVPYSYNNKNDEHLPVSFIYWKKDRLYTIDQLENIMDEKSVGMKSRQGFEYPEKVFEGGDGTGKGRNSWITSYAGHLYGLGKSYDYVLKECIDVDEAHNYPKLGEHAVEVIVESMKSTDLKNHPEKAEQYKVDEDLDNDVPREFFDVHSADEALLPRPPLEFVVENFIPKGTLTVVAGKPGIYKTSVMMNMGESVANGLSWLGLKTTKTNVLYIDVEMGNYTLLNRLEYVLKGLDTKEAHLRYTSQIGTFSLWKEEDRPRKILAHEIKRLGVGLCIIDPLSGILSGGDENDTGAVGMLFTNLKWVVEETGCAIVIIHHFGKNNENYRGSSEIEAKPDNLYLFKSPEKYSVVVESPKTRSHEPIPLAFHVSFNNMTHKLVVEKDEQRFSGKADPNGEEILDIVAQHGHDGMTITEILSFVQGQKPSTARNKIFELAKPERGDLVRLNKGKIGVEAIYGLPETRTRMKRMSVTSSGDEL